MLLEAINLMAICWSIQHKPIKIASSFMWHNESLQTHHKKFTFSYCRSLRVQIAKDMIHETLYINYQHLKS